VIIFGQLMSNVIYVRNIMLIIKTRQSESQTLSR
jgi:hypothetical protein